SPNDATFDPMDERKRVEDLRKDLTEIDLEILRMIERRSRVAQDLMKARTGTGKLAPASDGQHLAALERAVTPPFPSSAVRPIWNAIDAACRLFETVPRITFIGSEGGFGWLAARAYFGSGAELVRTDNAAYALEEVARSRAEFAVVPYESLKDGPNFPTI